jgi:hypothetical protein
MAELVRYSPEALARQQREHIEYIVEVTHAAQHQIGRIHTESAKLAIATLTETTERIQTAARNGMSPTKVAELVEQQKQYLATVRQQVAQGAAAITSVVQNLPALPAGTSNRRLTG